jgi:hypothetical protein
MNIQLVRSLLQSCFREPCNQEGRGVIGCALSHDVNPALFNPNILLISPTARSFFEALVRERAESEGLIDKLLFYDWGKNRISDLNCQQENQ